MGPRLHLLALVGLPIRSHDLRDDLLEGVGLPIFSAHVPHFTFYSVFEDLRGETFLEYVPSESLLNIRRWYSIVMLLILAAWGSGLTLNAPKSRLKKRPARISQAGSRCPRSPKPRAHTICCCACRLVGLGKGRVQRIPAARRRHRDKVWSSTKSRQSYRLLGKGVSQSAARRWAKQPRCMGCEQSLLVTPIKCKNHGSRTAERVAGDHTYPRLERRKRNSLISYALPLVAVLWCRPQLHCHSCLFRRRKAEEDVRAEMRESLRHNWDPNLGRRIGEASNPGPAGTRRTARVKALKEKTFLNPSTLKHIVAAVMQALGQSQQYESPYPKRKRPKRRTGTRPKQPGAGDTRKPDAYCSQSQEDESRHIATETWNNTSLQDPNTGWWDPKAWREWREWRWNQDSHNTSWWHAHDWPNLPQAAAGNGDSFKYSQQGSKFASKVEASECPFSLPRSRSKRPLRLEPKFLAIW